LKGGAARSGRDVTTAGGELGGKGRFLTSWDLRKTRHNGIE